MCIRDRCQSLASFRETIGQWLFGEDPEGKMNMAIFMDARAVSGDASLLSNAREHALKLAVGSNTFIGRMASAIFQFSEPTSGWWSRLQGREPETFDPVSYTHLDVYKRQALFSMAIGFVGIWLFSILDNSCLLYTSRCV